MTAAIHAARLGAEVTVLEHMDRVGKKLLSTGNGRCNFSNRDQRPEYYRCSQPDFPWKVISRFPVARTEEFFSGLGILVKERGTYLYPNPDQASSVLDVLRMELERTGVVVRTGCEVREIAAEGGHFRVKTDQGDYGAGAVVLAAGSKAAPATGSDGSGYALAERLGLRVITPLPALVQLRCGEKDLRQMAGVRTEARVRLYGTAGRSRSDGGDRQVSLRLKEHTRESAPRDGEWELLAEDRGELQFTGYGISGIPVFQVSRCAAVALHDGRRVKAVIDLLPAQTEEETWSLIRRRLWQMPEKTCEQWMTGLLNRKLSVVLLKRAGISPSRKAGETEPERWKELQRQLRSFETEIVATNSYEQAQVCCGGVDTAEVDPRTMGVKRVPGLYLAGEILDVDGICGGYNLQWAWSSGAVAGQSAAWGNAEGRRERAAEQEDMHL